MFDLSIKTTFSSLIKWEREAQDSGLDFSKSMVMVLGNKADLKKREVKTDAARDWARSRGFLYYETSAKSGANVKEAFNVLFEGVYNMTLDNRSKFFY